MCRKMRLREGNSKSKTPGAKHQTPQLQTPNTKLQTPEKLQNSKRQNDARPRDFGIWCLGFFGVWCLEFLGGFPAQENSEQPIDQASAAVGAAHRHVGHVALADDLHELHHGPQVRVVQAVRLS